MHEMLGQYIEEQRPAIRRRWSILLHGTRRNSAMASPSALVYLIDWALDQIRGELHRNHPRPPRASKATPASTHENRCVCGMNPLLGFYTTAERALIEVICDSRTKRRSHSPDELQVLKSALIAAVHKLAKREIDAFCAICQKRVKAQHARRMNLTPTRLS